MCGTDSKAAAPIQFGLSEKKSNPENVEKRREKNGVSAQSGTGSAVGGAGGEDGKGQGLTGFEATLKKVDDWLGGDK